MTITATLVTNAFVIGFMKNTNSNPILENTPTNTVFNLEASFTNKGQNLMIMKFDLVNKVEIIELDSLSTIYSLTQNTWMFIE